MVALVGWICAYHIGGRRLLGDAFEGLNVSNVNLDSLLQTNA